MNLSNLPTDNLYKFIALFGLILTIAGAFLYTRFSNESWMAIESAIYYNEKAAEKLNLLINLPSLKDKKIQDYLSKLNKEANELSQKGDRFMADSKTAHKQFDRWRVGIEWLLIVGVFLMVLGFSLWYLKLQRYLDIMIKFQSTSNCGLKSKSNLKNE